MSYKRLNWTALNLIGSMLRWHSLTPLALAGLVCGSSLAAGAQQLPSGAIQRYQRDQQLRDAIEQQNQKQLQERQEQQNKPKPDEEAQPLESTASFLYTSVRFIGVSTPWAAELNALANPYLNRPISLVDLEALRVAIRDSYRARNLLALVSIDPSGPKGGELVINVTEARMGEVKINSKIPHYLSDGIARATILASVPQGSLLRLDKLTSALLKLNDLPGSRINSTLQAGETLGQTDVVLTIKDGNRSSGELNVNNEINRYLGTVDVDLTLVSANQLGRGEQLTLDGQWWFNDEATGSLAGSVAYEMPITPDGASINLYANYSSYRLLQEFYPIDVNGYSSNIRLGIKQPLWRRPTQSLWGSFSGEYNAYVDKVENFEIRDKNSQVGRFSLLAEHQDSWLGTGLNTGFLQYSLGNLDRGGNLQDLELDSFTANTDGIFNKIGLIYSRYQIFSSRWQAKIFVQAQKAFNNLDGAEKMSLGYPNGVRAYPPGEAPGDSGFSGQFDLIYRVAPKLAFVAFLDGGVIWRWTEPFFGSLQPNSYGLAGTGIGVDIGTSGEWLASVKLAIPIGSNSGTIDDINADGEKQGPIVWASVRLWF
ncbi:ShlB/FhaC/HecB family hemolysin secretion/activation protein [Cyanobium sp. T1B-Tous]|uniref:ShlB/FhaC/HecB family hemolysin secretion/activation protein n=1 Tax=Cyanobium sp. T1B-Tous TaxID=2823721 RepID=UPI0020CD7D62|nr:ShlB/FhaC/HecB family hemolysin secretion/activation protein [Cyanobium sp. T1B-Tous]MCP9806658.1 ShlB/FhaC/HecB family hemolysin secretion/activation protein [Cyanobium sp. T1B-Tous]